jgi:putative inorganic carbon (HCO3(-)) transporter
MAMSSAIRRQVWRAAGREWDWLAVVLIAPFLMFPTQVPAATATVLFAFAVVSGYRSWRGLRDGARSPYTWPVGLLLVMALLGAWVSPIPELAFPKFCGVVLGIIACRAVISGASTPERLRIGIGLYVLLGLAMLAPGILAAQWADKFPGLGAVTRHIPRWFSEVPHSRAAVNANALGGTTLFFLPVLILWFCADSWQKQPGPSDRLRARSGRTWRRTVWPVVLTTILALLAVNVLSQSRTAWIALTVTMTGLAAVQWKRIRTTVLGVGLAVAVVIVCLGPGRVVGVLGSAVPSIVGNDPTRTEMTGKVRLEVWSTATQVLRDFPITGVGLGSFRQTGPMLYPLLLVPADVDIAHAHNIFLQTALDVGIPGLVAYLALLYIAIGLCWRAWSEGDATSGALALGLGGNLVALHLFGMTDAVALGTKVGLFFWLDLGLIGALHRCTSLTMTAVLAPGAPRSQTWTALTII